MKSSGLIKQKKPQIHSYSWTERTLYRDVKHALKYKDKSNVSQVAREYGYMPAAANGARLAASGLQNVIGTVSSIINR